MELIHKYFDEISPLQLQQLEALDALYKHWNNQINVISRKDIDSLYEKHVLHSLSIAAAFEFEPTTEILDIGTGGGFPGIPLAIFFPESKFHLVDSIGKKIKVAESIAESIGLKNCKFEQIRAEQLPKKRYDLVVSRAVAPLKDLWNWSKPLLRKSEINSNDELANGLICLKGGDLAREISDSGCRPRVMEIIDIFPEPYFKEKFILYVPYGKR
ncbi:MAG: 16S rRNA (guanine(527)-N(7))-methyltransferase RsmG [Bacteroidetes bacterium]|nr:MAG: 16S rRNA (guanine(527)-N(7))-methyltransferase RsmG [Bacteroidota bacterium]